MEIPSPIPGVWREQVIQHLRSGTVIFTRSGQLLWEATFPDAFQYELWQTLINTFSDESAEGIPVNDMAGGYDTYKFFFHHEGVKLYGKVGLHPKGINVRIYSAHRPRKGDTL